MVYFILFALIFSVTLAQDDETLIDEGIPEDYVEAPMYRLDLFEGDIAGVDPDTFRAANPSQKWPNGVVHYTIDNQFSSREKSMIDNAFQEYARKTCVKFIQRSNQRDYIFITPGQGCWSMVGKQGGKQSVSLQKNGCMIHATIVHELMHAIGFWHEQSRPDRDNYVTIQWNNVLSGQSHNFNKMNSQSLGSPYDYGSVMHYKSDAFSKSGNLKTIVAKKSGVALGNDRGLSTQDTWQINKMYGCKM